MGLHEITDARIIDMEGHVVITGDMECVEHMIHALRKDDTLYGTVLHKPILLMNLFDRNDVGTRMILDRLSSSLSNYRDVFLICGDPSGTM